MFTRAKHGVQISPGKAAFYYKEILSTKYPLQTWL